MCEPISTAHTTAWFSSFACCSDNAFTYLPEGHSQELHPTMFRLQSRMFRLASLCAFGSNTRMDRARSLRTPNRAARWALGFLLTTPLLGACGSGGGNQKAVNGNVAMTDENNYTATSSMKIPSVQTKAGADLDICWDKLTEDFQCHDMEPTQDITAVSFARFLAISAKDIADLIANGRDFDPYDYKQFLVKERAPGTTCTKLSSLNVGGKGAVAPATEYVVASDKTYMLFFSNGSIIGTGGRSMVFLEPSTTSDVTSVSAPTGCGMLDFKANLTDLKKLDIPTDGPWVLDWSQITRDGLDNQVFFQNIDSLMFAYYAGKAPADLEDKFLDLEIIPDLYYDLEIPVGDKHADLADGKAKDGTKFPGFTRKDGTWLVALRCSACKIPTPVALGIFNLK